MNADIYIVFVTILEGQTDILHAYLNPDDAQAHVDLATIEEAADPSGQTFEIHATVLSSMFES